MLKKELQKTKRLTDKVALEKEAAIKAIKRALPKIGTSMPSNFCLDFPRLFPLFAIDNMGIRAYWKDSDTPSLVVEWEALTVDEIHSLYEIINYYYHKAI